MKPDHEAYISIHQGKRFAYCCCGWESERRTTAIAAIKDRDKHLDDNDTDFWTAKAGGDHGTVR